MEVKIRYRCLWCGRWFDADEGIVVHVLGSPYPFCCQRCMILWTNFYRDQEEEFVATLEEGEAG